MNAFRWDSPPSVLVPARSFRAALGVSESGLRALVERSRVTEPIRLRGRRYCRPEDLSFHVEQRRRRHS
jgi:hypothetical protein